MDRSKKADEPAVPVVPTGRLAPATLDRLRIAGKALYTSKEKRISGRISGELLGAVKKRLGVTSDTAAIEMALVNMVMTDDFGPWLADQGGRLDPDFELEP